MSETQCPGEREEITEQDFRAGGGNSADRILLLGDPEGIKAPFLGVNDLLDEFPIAGLVRCAGERLGLGEEHELHGVLLFSP